MADMPPLLAAGKFNIFLCVISVSHLGQWPDSPVHLGQRDHRPQIQVSQVEGKDTEVM